MAYFEDQIARKASDMAVSLKAGRRISVAVLGPGFPEQGVPESPGSLKRRQIRTALEGDGHRAFFPEDLVESEGIPFSILNWETSLLRDPQVDLIVILHTDSSFGVIAELSHFLTVPEIRDKTVVLFPIEFYNPSGGLVSNIVQNYYYRTFYPEEHLKTCHVVAECRHWANVKAMHGMPQAPAYGF